MIQTVILIGTKNQETKFSWKLKSTLNIEKLNFKFTSLPYTIPR